VLYKCLNTKEVVKLRGHMLSKEQIKKIHEFVYNKPRAIQEVAGLLNVNWRTADRYIEKIANEEGTLSTRIFREGTRGALKLVFWSNIDKIQSSEIQEKLLRKIEIGRTKTDFSPFDIYQYVEENKRNAFLEEQLDEGVVVEHKLFDVLASAEKQLFIFSGNLSWINIVQNKKTFLNLLEDLALNHVMIKVIANVDFDSLRNVKEVLSINDKLGKEVIDLRHSEQPLRAFIVDNKIARLRELKFAEKSNIKKKAYIFYEIFDEGWIEWLQKVFWKSFRTGLAAQKRIKDLESIRRLK